MYTPQIEIVKPGGFLNYQLEHRNLHPRFGGSATPIASGEPHDHFRAGLGIIHSAMADSAEELGFRIARDDSGQLFRDLGRAVSHNDAMKAAAARSGLAKPGTAADAALQDAATLADSYGHIMRNTRMRLYRPFARRLAMQMREEHGAQVVADSVASWFRQDGKKLRGDVATMADADLNQAGGLVENLTAYIFMAFVEPQAPLHYRDVFRIQGGINIGLEFLQVLFYTMRGEAKVWDGTAGDYSNSGPGVSQLKLPVINFRSSDNLDIITAARELLVFNAANLRTKQLKLAHDLMHNRLAFGIQRQDPPQLPIQSLVNWPGLTVKDDGQVLNGITSLALYNELVTAIQEPYEISNQAFMPDRLGITVGVQTAMKAPMVIGGAVVADSVESFFVKNFPGVKIEAMWELLDLFGDNTEAIFAYPASGDAAPVYLMNEPIMLPQFTYGYGVRTDMYSTGAGLVWGAPVGAEVRLIAST